MFAETVEGTTPEAPPAPVNNSTPRVHRSLPRAKAILEDENYLAGVLQAVESANCATEPVATTGNAWMTAFHNVYDTVAEDCHLPQGKNRHHKFKDKVVELWNTIEQEVNEGTQSATHPLMALGLKQLELYRTVARTSSEKARRSSMGVAKDEESPPRKKQRKSKSSMDGVSAIDLTSTSVPADSIEAIMHRGLLRLETLALQQLPPKLPSPLYELHRIRLQLLQSQQHEIANLMEPFYSEAVGAYLQSVTHQANNSAHPAMLPAVLEGLDVLQQAPASTLSDSIRYTYKHVLSAYLKLINPGLAAKLKAKQQQESEEEDNDGSEQGGASSEVI